MLEQKYILSAQVREKIDLWLQKYPPDQKRSAVMQALTFAQEDNHGFLTTEIMDAVADYLGLANIQVYEVASFYTMYNVKPVGRHVINICTNISCMLCDSEKILEHVENRLGIKVNETTSDGKFTLREVECLAACIKAPVALVDKKYYENLTPEKIDAMLDELE
jgi:NADH-quinone oxidoreductase subunit E